MSRRGFTLIELLVVVAVLALLASIVFSNLGGAREGARISNALSFQSQTHSLLGSDLVGWWNFNDGDARDLSGHGNNGTITGATFTDGVPGTGGSALSFNGVGDYVDAGNNESLNITNAITASAWIKPTTTGQVGSVLEKGDTFNPPAEGYLLLVISDAMYWRIGDGTDNDRLNPSFTSTDWTQVVGTFDGDRLIMYFNGIEVASKNTSLESIAVSGSTLKIGRRSAANTQYFNGLIDDVRIYSRALTASEIQTLYAETKDKYLAKDR